VRRACLPEEPAVSPVLTGADILELVELARQVRLDEKLLDYIVALVTATRDPAAAGLPALAGKIAYGASPRAAIALAQTAKAMALLCGRGYATPGDIKALAPDVLRHRVLLTYEAQAEGLTPDSVVRTILETVAVP
jgi:MoxR-like ATPase